MQPGLRHLTSAGPSLPSGRFSPLVESRLTAPVVQGARPPMRSPRLKNLPWGPSHLLRLWKSWIPWTLSRPWSLRRKRKTTTTLSCFPPSWGAFSQAHRPRLGVPSFRGDASRRSGPLSAEFRSGTPVLDAALYATLTRAAVRHTPSDPVRRTTVPGFSSLIISPESDGECKLKRNVHMKMFAIVPLVVSCNTQQSQNV